MELWRAPAGSGKTEAIVALIAETLRARPLARVWVVLPGSRQSAQFRERLLSHLQGSHLAAFNVELFNFYSLNRRLLNLMRVPVRSLGGGARQAILRRVAVRESLHAFSAVADLPGFSHAVGELIAELKQAWVEPEEFTLAAQTPKDGDLAKIYVSYQSILRRHGLVDIEGEAWLALDSLRDAPAWDARVALLAVDGFDQFTGVQAQLVQALDKRAGRTVVTLTEVDGREDGVGRRFTSAEIALGSPPSLRLTPLPHPQPAVRYLLVHAFSLGGAIEPIESGAARTLTLIEAHSPSAEAAEVMRQIKQRLVLDRVAPDDVMVVLRDWMRYQPALSSAAHEFGVPVSLQSGVPLTRHPLAAALDAILNLPETDYAFEAVIDALRSPYVMLDGLPPGVLAKVEKSARKFNLRVGRDAWDAALENGARPGRDYLDRETPPILTPDEQRSASDALNLLFDALPLAEDTDRVWNFVGRIEELIGVDPEHEADAGAKLAFSLEIAQQVRRSETIGDDLAALRAIKGALKDMLLTEDLLAALTDDGGRSVTWRAFLGNFRAALDGTELSASPDRSGRVLVTTATDARGAAHAHVYILGLSEGVFPAPLPNDPLYLDSERAHFRRDGQPILRSAADRADDDSIFFELLAQARESLTLSRPALNGGQMWPPSALWNAVTALLANGDFLVVRRRITPGRPPAMEHAASLPELAAAFHARSPDSAVYRAYMDEHDPRRAAHIAHAQRVERGRIALAESGDSSGVHAHVADFSAPALVALTSKLGRSNYLWSASTINALASCAYRVFAEKLLGLEELEDPTEGADAALEGDLMHRILEQTYAGFRSRRRPIAPENLDFALGLLDEAAQDVFQNAIDRRELIPSAIWPQQQQVIVRFLSELVRRDFSADSPVTMNFGAGERWTVATEIRFGDEPHRPLVLSAQGESGRVDFRLTGTIDRVDCIDDGETLRLIVVDYKRGSQISNRDVAEGRSTQLVLYTAALQQVLDEPDSPERLRWFADSPNARIDVAGGLFWSVRTGKPLHILSPAREYPVDKTLVSAAELCEHVMHAVAERIARLRAGDYRPLPSNPKEGTCATFCAFADLCRVCEMVTGR